ncbi:MAG: C39 family peptidase [Methanobacteriaceae archaeon]
MQSTDYSCGPAALATVLQNIGISATEGELKVLAGTNNETGTNMYGLARAVHAKGLNATGMKLSVDDLRTNMIVHVILDGEGHYSVIREITESSVKLADPSKGNIVLSRGEFAEIFTGNVLVISDPNMQVNQTGTSEQTNGTQAENLTAGEMESIKGQSSTSVLSENSELLTSEQMQTTIRGRGIITTIVAFAVLVYIGGVLWIGHRLIKWAMTSIGKRVIVTRWRWHRASIFTI